MNFTCSHAGQGPAYNWGAEAGEAGGANAAQLHDGLLAASVRH